MNENRKIWLGLGAALLAGSTATHADDTTSFNNFNNFNHHASPDAMQLAALSGEGGEGAGGEGEGGEGEGGEGAGPADLTRDDAAYLAQLGLVHGHLWVGVQLYKAGYKDMALTHMKHPGDELYAGLQPAFDARRVSGFAEALDRLAEAVEQGLPVSEVEARHGELEQGIARAEKLAETNLKTALGSIEKMVRTAAEEYAIGVKDGKIVNAHEYQDALGFVTAAQNRLDSLREEQIQQGPEAVEEVAQQLGNVRSLWPALVPEGKIDGDASQLFGAAARIQLATWELE